MPTPGFTSRLIHCILLFVLLQGCQMPGEDGADQGAQANVSDEGQDHFPEECQVEYAENFSVSYRGNFKVAHIHFRSEQRDIQFEQKIVLVQRGTPKPALSGDLAGAWLVEVPLKTVAANDDGEITRLKALGLVNDIVAMGGGGIYDPELRRLWEAGQIASIGYSFHRPPQPEVILSLKPDLLLLYAYDLHRLESVEKLRGLDVNAVPQFAWAEPSLLGKAEWLKFSALFFNREEAANMLFDSIATRCQTLMDLAAQQKTKTSAFKTYFPSSDSDWSVHRNDFYAALLESAGAENILKDEGPSHAVGMTNEQLLSLAKDADVWITNSTSDREWPPRSYLESFKAYRTGRVFHYQKRTRHEHDAYDWYETPEVRPDLVLQDLISILYPGLLPEHKLLFFDEVELNRL